MFKDTLFNASTQPVISIVNKFHPEVERNLLLLQPMNTQKLNLPDFSAFLMIDSSQQTIFDPFRKKHVALTPEEWVRQNFAQYLVRELNYPSGLITTEMTLHVHQLIRRCDIVTFDKSGKPRVIVECKAPSVKISQKTFDQIATYNLKLNVDFLIVTNGLTHYCCKMNPEENSYAFQKQLPEFSQLS